MKEQLMKHLAGHPWQANLHYYDSIDSTNTQAKRMAAQGAPHGTVLVARHQTGGRGRLGRSFHSPEGSGVYLSVILRPDCMPGQLMHLTCAAAVAMCDAVEHSANLRPGIKWINDLVIGNQKLGGILTELGLEPGSGRVSYAVIGIGINCAQQADDFPPEIRQIATSLNMACGNPIDPMLLAAHMIRALHRMDAGIFIEKNTIMDAYRRNCVTLGKQVQLLQNGTVRPCTAMDIDDDGALIVVFQDGHRETVNSGEVSVRGMYGYV